MARFRMGLAVAAAALAVVSTSVVFAGTAGADPLPIDGAACSASQLGQQVYGDVYSNVKAVLTYFTALNVATGTTGSRTDTLTHVNTVTKTVTNSTGVNVTASASAGAIIAKVSTSISATYNYSVATTETTTDTSSTSMTWNFTEPGFYGLYQGTHEIDGVTSVTTCVNYPYSSVPIGWKTTDYWFTMFTAPEEGTVRCTGTAPTTPDFYNPPVSTMALEALGSC